MLCFLHYGVAGLESVSITPDGILSSGFRVATSDSCYNWLKRASPVISAMAVGFTNQSLRMCRLTQRKRLAEGISPNSKDCPCTEPSLRSFS